MRREDAPVCERCGSVQAQAFKRLVRRKVALAARNGLHVLAGARSLGGDVDGAREQRHVKKLGQTRHEARVVVGVLAPQAMVHMQHDQLAEHATVAQLARHVRECRRVRTARHHEQCRRLRTHKAALGKRRRRAVDGRNGFGHGSLPFIESARRRRYGQRREQRRCAVAETPTLHCEDRRYAL